MSAYVVPKWIYFAIFLALMVLTGVTVWVAFVDLGPLNTVVAISIAVVKALLVVLWFMHVKYNDGLIWVFAGAGFFWLAILIGLVLSDVVSRGWLGIPVSEFLVQ